MGSRSDPTAAPLTHREPAQLVGHRLPSPAQHAAEHASPAEPTARCAAWPVRSRSRRCTVRPRPDGPACSRRSCAATWPAVTAVVPPPHRSPVTPRHVPARTAIPAVATRARSQHRQAHLARHNVSSADQVRRRRSNVLFMLVLAAAGALFLAATTQEPAMLYLFALDIPVAVRLRLPAVAGAPSRVGVLADRLDASLIPTHSA